MTTPKKTVEKRLTQAERRALTIRRLSDATIEALLEVGYARTTVKEICTRAGLSDGALFRFFPSLLDLIYTAASEVGQQQIAQFEAHFAEANDGSQPLATALTVLRDVCRSKTNTVFHELLVAARTDPTLRERLAPGLAAYNAAIRHAAQRLPGIEGVPPQLLDAVVFGVSFLFDGEALVRTVFPQPAIEDARLDLLKNVAATLTSQLAQRKAPPGAP